MRIKTSLALLLATTIGILTLGMLVPAGALTYRWLCDKENRDLAALGNNLASQASIGLSLPLWNLDDAQIHLAARSLMDIPQVHSVRIEDTHVHRTLVDVQRSAAPPDALQLYRTDITYEGSRLGTLVIGIDRRPLERESRQMRLAFATGTLLLSLLLGGALYALVWKLVLRPVKALEGFARSVLGHTGGNFPAMGEVYSGELASLRNALSGMLSLLRRHFQELSESEESLRLARDAAEKANRSKSAFLANMSHEIRTPMNAVMGMLNLAMEHSNETEVRNRIVKALTASKSLLTTLNDLLDFSKIESGHMELELAPFSLPALLDTLRDLFEVNLLAKGLEFQITVEPEVPSELVGDVHRLHQILANLLANAAKFTSTGSIRLSVRSLDTEAGTQRLEFRVTDTGIGISSDQLARLFLPFSQADVSTTRRYGGCGLGLAICRTLVQLQGGNIAVDSVPGQGSEFRFDIRVHLPDSHQRLPAPTPAQPGVDGRIGRILVVEDNPFNQEIAKSMLELDGHHVEVADHGGQAVERFAQTPFDLVLMDLHMPVMDGLEATRRIRSLPAGESVPIIALTAAATQDDLQRTHEAGMLSHIVKPFEPAQLLQTVREALEAADRERIVIALDGRDFTEASDLASLVGFNGNALSNALQQLSQECKLVHEGNARETKYKLA